MNNEGGKAYIIATPKNAAKKGEEAVCVDRYQGDCALAAQFSMSVSTVDTTLWYPACHRVCHWVPQMLADGHNEHHMTILWGGGDTAVTTLNPRLKQ
jgi:hypothetical protein